MNYTSIQKKKHGCQFYKINKNKFKYNKFPWIDRPHLKNVKKKKKKKKKNEEEEKERAK